MYHVRLVGSTWLEKDRKNALCLIEFVLLTIIFVGKQSMQQTQAHVVENIVQSIVQGNKENQVVTINRSFYKKK